MRLAIIADDFTGANDVALQIRKYGLEVVSLVDENLVTDSEVDVISSETRNSQPEAAKKRVEEIFLKIKKNGFEKFYKKIDSTLRGNLREEIEAILENTSQEEKIVVVPSFPTMGRIVKDGRLYVNGIPLNMSEFSRDPIHPIKTSDVGELFKLGENIFLQGVRGDLEKILQEIEGRVVILDAESDGDLELISKALISLGMDRYVVGSAGIMEYLMKGWGYKKERVLMVSGSCNDKNIEQVDYFLGEKSQELNVVDLDIKNRERNSNKNLENDRDIFIRSLSEKSEMYELIEKGYSTDEISDYIGWFAAEVAKKFEINKIFISGGETTLKVLKNLGIKGLKVKKQMEPGIPICQSFNGKYEIITKSGGYGTLDIFEKCRSRF